MDYEDPTVEMSRLRDLIDEVRHLNEKIMSLTGEVEDLISHNTDLLQRVVKLELLAPKGEPLYGHSPALIIPAEKYDPYWC